MGNVLRVLVVENSEDDALLMVRELERGGYEADWQRVETAEEMKTALKEREWDVVLSDYTMPRLSAPKALESLQGTGLDLPFIVISVTIGEDVAVQAMKAGAHDFFLKGNMTRLVAAIEREMREVEERRRRRAAEEERDSQRRLLAERIKEIRCLYGISGLVAEPRATIEESLKAALELIPPGWQYPETTRARIVFEGNEFASEGFRETPCSLSADIVVSGQAVGSVEVFSLEERPELDEGPFLEEERRLIDDIARQLGVMIERDRAEKRMQLARDVLSTINQVHDMAGTIGKTLRLIKEAAGMEAVGIRLREGDDFPYYETNGFSEEFVEVERHLCAYDEDGKVIRDGVGNPVLECMCGNVLCGRTDASLPFFTDGGSFWTNSTTDLLASTTEADRQARTRNRCNGEGYESVALIPLRSGDEINGLLQLNDRRRDQLTLERVRFFEGLGASIGISLSRQQAEAELKSLKQQMEFVLGATNTGIDIIDPEFSVRYIDPEWQKVYGDPTGRKCYEYFMGRDDVCPGCGLVKALETKQISVSEEVLPRENNRPIQVTSMPFQNDKGEWLFAEVNVDITERKRAEEEIRRFERAVEASSDAVGMSTPQGKHYYQNRTFDDLFGEIGDDPPATLYLDEAVGRDVFETIMSGREWTGEVRMRGKEGNVLIMLLRAYAIKDGHGAISGLVGVHTDITQQRSMEAQLRQAQKMESVGRLAGGVAHDFNNLLMGTMNYVELCRDGIAPDHPIREWLDEITADSQRSANLTRQLLAFARKQTIAPKVLDLNDAIASMLKLLLHLIGEDIDLAWLPGPELGTVKMDPAQIDQILANLCVNARDAIDGVGKLTIESENAALDAEYCASHAEFVPGDYVVLSVSDDGCGMDAETREHIFEPFFTTKSTGEGTGLGLATVYGIVKQNNGFVNVYSEPGKGTTFRIYLPRFRGETVDAADAAAPAALPGGNETILLVEDEKSIRVTAALFLKAFGYTVLAADCPEQALRLAAEHAGEIHLLITDVVMPGQSGRDLATELATDRPEMKRLFMSGYTANVIAHRGVLDEGVEFLGKPFTRDELAHKVREVLASEK